MQKRGRKSLGKIEWKVAPDIKKRAIYLSKRLDMTWVDHSCVYYYRSTNSKARAYARCWGLPRLWQRSLDVPPSYIIEVISEMFDKLNSRRMDEVLIHELTHIPRNFSGALISHTRHLKGGFHDKLKAFYENYNSSRRRH